MIEFKEFRIDDILQKVETKKIPIKKGDCPVCPTEEYNLPARTATSQNQGLSCYVPRDVATILNNVISVSANGDYCAFWHDKEFTILQDSYALEGNGFKLTTPIAVYIISCMNRVLAPKYNWGNKSGWEKIRKEQILLPVTPTGKPDFDYMERYISELEKERISELEKERISELDAYLKATGLEDYKLTDEDKEVLAENVEFKEFRLNTLFTSESGNFDIKKEHINGKGVNVITSGETDNGILGKTDIDAKIISFPSITVDMFGKAVYRNDPYKMVTHARVFALLPKFDMKDEVGIYLTVAINKITSKYSYNNMCSWNKINEQNILLPVTPSGQPDFDYMERYIRAIEKLAIKDVVKYKDKVIETTKQLIN